MFISINVALLQSKFADFDGVQSIYVALSENLMLKPY